jgi:hypothetical protein
VQCEAEARERISAWVARRTQTGIRSISCLISGGVLGACYIAEVTNPQMAGAVPARAQTVFLNVVIVADNSSTPAAERQGASVCRVGIATPPP